MHPRSIKKHNCLGQDSFINQNGTRNPTKRAKSCPRPKTRRHPEDTPKRYVPSVRSKSMDSKHCENQCAKKKCGSNFISQNGSVTRFSNAKIKSLNSDVEKELKDLYKNVDKCVEENELIKPFDKDDGSSTSFKENHKETKSKNIYLQFLLRITEDIIKHDCYSDNEMKKIFLEHIQANRNKLNVEKMLLQIKELTKELNFSPVEDDNAYWNEIRNAVKYDFSKNKSDPMQSEDVNFECLCPHYQAEKVDNFAEQETKFLDYEKHPRFLQSLDRLTECTEPPSSRNITEKSNITSCSTFGCIDSLPGFESLKTPRSVTSCSSKKIADSANAGTCCSKSNHKIKKPLKKPISFICCPRIRIKNKPRKKESKEIMKCATSVQKIDKKCQDAPLIITYQLPKTKVEFGVEYLLLEGPLYIDKIFFMQNRHSIMLMRHPSASDQNRTGGFYSNNSIGNQTDFSENVPLRCNRNHEQCQNNSMRYVRSNEFSYHQKTFTKEK